MAGKKRKAPQQRGKNAYAKELQEKKRLGYEIAQDWTAQLALDTIAMVLNDPDVMGRDVLGKARLMKVCEGFNKLWPDHLLALSAHDEAEYWRVKIDQAQARIFGPEYLHWHERYPYWDEKDTY